MKKVSIFLIVVAAFLTVTLKSCQDEEKKEVPVTGVSFASDKQTLTEGSFLTLQYTVRPENATNQNVTFTSSKTDVATVDAISGRVTAKAPGTAEITVTTEDGAKKDYCTVTVTKADVPVTDVVLGPAAITLNKVGEEYQLNASVVPANADNKLLEWESDKPAVATVDETGKVTALTSGTANIKVKTSEGAKEKTCVVTVDILVTGVTLRSGLSLVLTDPDPESETLTATVYPDEALVRGVTWAIEPATGVATLTDNGDGTATVVASGEGTAVITVTTVQGDFMATCNLTVSLPPDKPVGADFTQAVVYNFSAGNGGTKFPEVFGTGNGFFGTGGAAAEGMAAGARFVTMDLEHVFIAGRELLDPPFLLGLDDLKAGTVNPVRLNVDDVPAGGYKFGSGQMRNGHLYMNNMTLGVTGTPFRIYHWDKTKATDDLEIIGTFGAGGIEVPTTVIRVGDNVSYNIDESGNGYLFTPVNASANILRVKITNFNETSDPVVIAIPEDRGPFATYQQVDGQPNEYLISGRSAPTILADVDGNGIYTMTSFAGTDNNAARVVNFNEARYLICMNSANVTNAAGTAWGEINPAEASRHQKVITVYDITKGGTTREALEELDAKGDEKEPVYEFSLDSYPSDGCVSIEFVKDDANKKLYIVGSGQQAGFAIIELPAVNVE